MTKRVSLRQSTPEKEELYRQLKSQLALKGQSMDSWFWEKVQEELEAAEKDEK
ncbi:hypothetical protein LCGC14_1042380 [marine sediment metagenome]|uniref:Uncharacterized protein n=1 Tax=marine sediment metagenome TaxID=412755 RepID=A0A0F9ND28_9ZZZZ